MNPKRESTIFREHACPSGRLPEKPVRCEPGPVRRLSSTDLFGADDQVEIEHRHVLYRLRITSLGKLILTK